MDHPSSVPILETLLHHRHGSQGCLPFVTSLHLEGTPLKSLFQKVRHHPGMLSMFSRAWPVSRVMLFSLYWFKCTEVELRRYQIRQNWLICPLWVKCKKLYKNIHLKFSRYFALAQNLCTISYEVFHERDSLHFRIILKILFCGNHHILMYWICKLTYQ